MKRDKAGAKSNAVAIAHTNHPDAVQGMFNPALAGENGVKPPYSKTLPRILMMLAGSGALEIANLPDCSLSLYAISVAKRLGVRWLDTVF